MPQESKQQMDERGERFVQPADAVMVNGKYGPETGRILPVSK